MKIDTGFVRSKLGRRIVTLFLLCALLPIGVLAVLSFTHVTSQFTEQNQQRLRRTSKLDGMAVLRRIELLDSQLKMLAADMRMRPADSIGASLEGLDENLQKRVNGLELVGADGRKVPLLGNIQSPARLTELEVQHLGSDLSLLTTRSRSELPFRPLLIRALDPARPKGAFLVAELNGNYLWGLETMSETVELCVLEGTERVLFSSTGMPVPFLEQLLGELSLSSTGRFDWEHEEQEYMAGYWSIFLKGLYLSPGWTVVISESEADVLAPLANFRKTFPLVILVSIWVVLLLSLVQIRRNLVPLKKLQAGTRRISQQDFDSRVDVSSGDEFEELAASFNTMANRLGKQFRTLSVMNEIDRVILSALDTHDVADTLLSHVRDILPCDAVSVTLVDSEDSDSALTHTSNVESEGEKRVVTTVLAPDEMQPLLDNPGGININTREDVPQYLAPLAEYGMKSFFTLPILVKDQLAGIVSLGSLTPTQHSQEDLGYARQLTDQVAVAMSNARLTSQRQELMSMFERYVSPEVAAEILKRRGEIVLAGEEKTATVLFSDIRNFTEITAGKPSSQVLAWLNNYFEAMAEIIMANGGFLNKFMGDGMLVIFGVPLSQGVEKDACQAVLTASQMVERVQQINADPQSGQSELRIGVGLHTGTLTAGNLGTADRMEYSVIGETVNLASRLEGLTKEFSTGIVMSAQTRELVRSQFETELLGEVAVRGFSEESHIYTLPGQGWLQEQPLAKGKSQPI